MKNRLLIVLLVALLYAGLYRAPGNAGEGQIWEPCSVYVYSNAGRYMACPTGDVDRLDAAGLTISVIAKDLVGFPIPGILPSDIWVEGCNSSSLAFCGLASMALNADAATDAEGRTTISGRFPAGGCDSLGVRVVVLGVYARNANANAATTNQRTVLTRFAIRLSLYYRIPYDFRLIPT